jgi:hypothetical protein
LMVTSQSELVVQRKLLEQIWSLNSSPASCLVRPLTCTPPHQDTIPSTTRPWPKVKPTGASDLGLSTSQTVN